MPSRLAPQGWQIPLDKLSKLSKPFKVSLHGVSTHPLRLHQPNGIQQTLPHHQCFTAAPRQTVEIAIGWPQPNTVVKASTSAHFLFWCCWTDRLDFYGRTDSKSAMPEVEVPTITARRCLTKTVLYKA